MYAATGSNRVTNETSNAEGVLPKIITIHLFVYRETSFNSSLPTKQQQHYFHDQTQLGIIVIGSQKTIYLK